MIMELFVNGFLALHALVNGFGLHTLVNGFNRLVNGF